MPSSKARHTARSWSAALPLIISPPTLPQPKPSNDTSRPVLPNLRFSTAAASIACLVGSNPRRRRSVNYPAMPAFCRRLLVGCHPGAGREPPPPAHKRFADRSRLSPEDVGGNKPVMITTPAADPTLIEDLVAANRILYDQGVVDGFGHVSVRHDKRPEHFLLARSMAPGLVTADDIMEFDRDGEPVEPQGRRVYLERFIHSEIYKAQ